MPQATDYFFTTNHDADGDHDMKNYNIKTREVIKTGLETNDNVWVMWLIGEETKLRCVKLTFRSPLHVHRTSSLYSSSTKQEGN